MDLNSPDVDSELGQGSSGRKRKKNRSWELNWHERTRAQRKGEINIWSRGTLAGVICAVLACVICVGGAYAWPSISASMTTASTAGEQASSDATSTSSADQEVPAVTTSTASAASVTTTLPATGVEQREQQIDSIISSMTTEQKVAQLFIVTPEDLTGSSRTVTTAGDSTEEAIQEYPVGGIVYTENNLISSSQTTEMLESVQKYSNATVGIPLFLAISEEGGDDSAVGGDSYLTDADAIDDARTLGEEGDAEATEEAYKSVGTYLAKLGLNLDLAPVADIANNPNDKSNADRSFGSDPDAVSSMVTAAMRGLNSSKILSAVKYFPGTGGATTDSRTGEMSTTRTLDEMRTTEFLPFQAAMRLGVSFVMVGHLQCPQITGDDTPASLSSAIVTDVLRNELSYSGIIITDALDSEAITENYKASEVGVKAILAGNDMIFCPSNFEEAYNGVLEAVRSGEISEERLEESLRRIIDTKFEMGDSLSSSGYRIAAGRVS